jgi:hypothetical protein
MEEDDIDRPIEVFESAGPKIDESWFDSFDANWADDGNIPGPIQFGESLEYLGYKLLDDGEHTNEQLVVATFWRILQPLDQAVLFTHVIGHDGLPAVQADRLDVPGDFWVPGDVFIQLHQIALPDTLSPGQYPLAIGVYTADTMQRLPVTIAGQFQGDQLLLPEVAID